MALEAIQLLAATAKDDNGTVTSRLFLLNVEPLSYVNCKFSFKLGYQRGTIIYQNLLATVTMQSDQLRQVVD